MLNKICFYTVTLNPAIDYTVELDEINYFQTNKAKYENCSAGGKGINVSQVLYNLGMNTKALGFAGGFTGKEIIRELNRKNIENDFIKVNGNSRINVKLICGGVTEINGSGPEINPEDINKLKEKLTEIKSNDIVIFSGSIPKGVSETIYKELLEAVKCRYVLDTTGKAFLYALEKKPLLVKPNISELEQIFEIKINTIDEVVEYGKKLVDMGAENVIVSMGEKGALYVDSYKNHTYIKAVEGNVINTVGAGDSMLAGFIYGITNGFDNISAFKYAVAAGSACAFSEGLPLKENIDEIYNKV